MRFLFIKVKTKKRTKEIPVGGFFFFFLMPRHLYQPALKKVSWFYFSLFPDEKAQQQQQQQRLQFSFPHVVPGRGDRGRSSHCLRGGEGG